ncbi:hypothetical protein PR048_006393 [Dryococelus australis]|uniref:Uncharacterized protein n=1 Tax=Dryococelus australis TaxID=614101 RepID=A0ABQ9IAV6_9NEOP|nr:hypothetical protein PR048_006393 [Dryococelus australis]
MLPTAEAEYVTATAKTTFEVLHLHGILQNVSANDVCEMAFRKISKLNINEPDTWHHCKTRFLFFVEENKITEAKHTPKELTDCTYEELIVALDIHFDPKKNEITACFVFTNHKQQPTETISDFVAELKRFSKGCNFLYFEKHLLIRLLLAEPELTLDKVVKLSIAFEAGNKNAETILAAQNEIKQISDCNTMGV